jgi:hypothetical protein
MAIATSTNKTSALVAGFNIFPDGSGIDGTFTCNGATAVTVTNPNLAAGHSILVTLVTPGGTVGVSPPSVRTRTNGVGFTITGLASDTSVYSYKFV